MAKFSGLGGRLYRGETSVDFIGKRKIWYSISGLLIIASAVTLFTQGLHLGMKQELLRKQSFKKLVMTKSEYKLMR